MLMTAFLSEDFSTEPENQL